TVIVFIVFCISAIMGANHGQLDLNFLQLAPGTVIDLGPYTWIEEAYDHWEYDHELMIYNVLIYSYFPKLLLGLIVAAFSITVASQGRKMVLEQESLTQKNASVTAELSLATRIQESMLPNLFPAFPERPEFDLFASMNPAKEVGGDFYDFFMVDDDHLALVMADVSGKGIPGAMFMMFSKNIIANNVMLGKNPARALADANAAICQNNAEEMFVTVWLGVLEISTGKLTCANGGHEYPFFKLGDEFTLYKDKHGFSVGWFDDSEYTEYEIQLNPGDRLFVYTDGVPEATNGSGEMYGTDRALEVLQRDKDASCEKLLEDVWQDVGVFVGDAEQFDDLTMLALEYKGKA
ncbi:MAG: PP2C family protein-serine/threonine phosphatase, partial [Lachnospiraceae bacterium]|nr:PP2C family protein-serine/threonine phosphatase [Lachnospiraceae bacterium]